MLYIMQIWILMIPIQAVVKGTRDSIKKMQLDTLGEEIKKKSTLFGGDEINLNIIIIISEIE